MDTRMKIALAAYIAAMNLLLIAALISVWPGGTLFTMPADTRFLITATLAGALGSCIHLSTSFVSYAGHGSLQQSWAVWYFLRPGIGAALALVVYFALHAGLVTGAGDTSAAALNPYGVASIAALSGMFSKQATEKLREVFENICATKHPETPATDTPATS